MVRVYNGLQDGLERCYRAFMVCGVYRYGLIPRLGPHHVGVGNAERGCIYVYI